MESKLELPEVDMFITPLLLQEGHYLCQTDIEFFRWAILSKHDIESNVKSNSDTLPGILHAYGPLADEL